MKLSFFISLIFMICACNNNSSFLNNQKPSPEDQDFFIPKVYFNKNNHFLDIKTLNRENKTLDLYDQVVFSTEKDFLNNKDSVSFNLKPLEKFTNKEKVKIRVSSFCSRSKIKMTEHQGADRSHQEMAGSSLQISFSIIDLIPKKFLSEYLDKEFYCTFIFSIKDKSQNLNHYSLTQQKIQADFSNSRGNPLALIQETDSGYDYTPTNYIIDENNIKTVLLLNNTEQPVTNYELFCGGRKIMDVPDFKANVNPTFAGLMSLEKLPKELKRCRFFSKNENKVTGVTRSFLMNFSRLNMKSKTIDLKLIKEPIFVDISEKDVYPESFKERYQLDEWVRNSFVKPPKPYISSENSLALNAYIHFKNLNQINLNESYSSIDVLLETTCLDTNPNPENNLFGLGQLLSTSTRLPIREKIPIAAALPSQIFKMGRAYDKWARELIDLHKDIERNARYISKREEYNKRQKIFNKRYAEQLTVEARLREIRNQVTCLYTVKLEDANNSQNNREFETKAYQILWTRAGYGVSYTAFPEGQNPFISLDQQANTEKRKFESIRFHSTMGYINLNFFDLIGTPILQKERYGLENFALSCNSPNNQDLYLSWPYSPAIKGQIILKDLFSQPDFKNYIEDQNKANCRVLLYETGGLLKYFSGEIRLR